MVVDVLFDDVNDTYCWENDGRHDLDFFSGEAPCKAHITVLPSGAPMLIILE